MKTVLLNRLFKWIDALFRLDLQYAAKHSIAMYNRTNSPAMKAPMPEMPVGIRQMIISAAGIARIGSDRNQRWSKWFLIIRGSDLRERR